MDYLHVDAEFSSVFRFTLENGEYIIASLNETSLTHEMYTNKDLYTRLGQSFCLVYDVSLGKGGSEAVVESIYSVLKSQQPHGNLTNHVLVARTSIDLHCPLSPLGIMDFIDEGAVLHVEKRNPAICKTNFGLFKVMKRMMGDEGKSHNKLK